MRLHFREYGAGEPLIILHGLFGSLDNWAYVSGQLSESFHVFAIDLRNHGRSPHSAEMNYDVMSADIGEFLRSHSISRAHLMGHSMGGKTAMRFASLIPEAVDRLIIVDIAPHRYEPAHDAIFEALLALDLETFETRQQVEEMLSERIPDLAVRRFLLKGLAKGESGGFRWKFNLPALHHNYPRLNEALPEESPCNRPALFIRGEQSSYVNDRDLPEIQRRFPRAEMALIPGASHWVHAEAPDLFLKSVLGFLPANRADAP